MCSIFGFMEKLSCLLCFMFFNQTFLFATEPSSVDISSFREDLISKGKLLDDFERRMKQKKQESAAASSSSSSSSYSIEGKHLIFQTVVLKGKDIRYMFIFDHQAGYSYFLAPYDFLPPQNHLRSISDMFFQHRGVSLIEANGFQIFIDSPKVTFALIPGLNIYQVSIQSKRIGQVTTWILLESRKLQ